MSELDGRTIGSIVEGWAKELEASVAQFEGHADVLQEWDKHVYQSRCGRQPLMPLLSGGQQCGAEHVPCICRQEMADLGQDTVRVIQLQEALLRKLDMLEAHQGKVHASLGDMETEAHRLFEQEADTGDAVDNERAALASRAIAVSEDLARCLPPPPPPPFLSGARHPSCAPRGCTRSAPELPAARPFISGAHLRSLPARVTICKLCGGATCRHFCFA